MTQTAPGEWYIAVVCKPCNRPVILFHDMNEGNSELANSQFLITCPNCDQKGSYQAEHHRATTHSPGYSPLRMAPIPLVYFPSEES